MLKSGAKLFLIVTVLVEFWLLVGHQDGAVLHRLAVLAVAHHALTDVLLRVEQDDVELRGE